MKIINTIIVAFCVMFGAAEDTYCFQAFIEDVNACYSGSSLRIAGVLDVELAPMGCVRIAGIGI